MFFIPIIMTYFKTGLVPRIPTLVVCGFAMLAAIQSLFSGLILQTLVQKNRQDFEMNIQRYSDMMKEKDQIDEL